MFVKEMNQQSEARASLLAGNIQCTQGFAEAWRRMPVDERDQIRERWQEILDQSGQIVEDVVASIESHEQLGLVWRELTDKMRSTRIGIFRCILLGDITHPDGTVSTQRKM